MSNWQIGGIDFSDYGVYISRSQGVLDIPGIQNTGHDWLDEHGKDYHADAIKLADREIVLTCWLYAEAISPASAYETFTTKVSAFFGAMLSPGYKTLRTPYGDVDAVYLKDQVPVLRESNYITDQQIGTFTMRLTVPGDLKYNIHTIYLPAGTASGQYLLTNNLQVNRTLQGESYATCGMETNAPLNVEMYSYIKVNTNGIVSEPYYFMAKPEVNKLSTNKYTYNLRLEHGSVLLKQSQFLFDGISEFDIFADLNTIIDLVVTNAGRFIPGKFVKGTVETTGSAAIKKNHNFKGEDCYSVVKRMAQEYGLEYDIRYTVVGGVYYTIDIKSQIATTKAITLEYGRGNGLYELTREAPNRDQLVTVLYAYGSTKNIKPDYRSGKPRLEFTGNPLRQNDTLYMGVEKTVFFDDIYPQRTAPITGYTQILKCEEADPGWSAYAAIKELWPGGMYRVEDNTVFDLNAYLLDDGRKAKIRFKTGAMAGYEFEIEKYDHVPGHIFIIPFKDQNGYMMPNETLYPSALDEYTLVDIDQPTSYVTVAEAELLATAQEYIDKYSVPEYPYRGRVDPAFLSGIIGRFEVGDRITIVDTDMGINAMYRISNLLFNDYTGFYDFLFSEHRILTRRERQQIIIDRVERTLQATNSDTVETIRKEKETANEIRNRIFTPADDLQNVDHTIRDESIDPRMLAFDAGIPQFQVKGCIGESPWLDDYNKVHLTSGYIEVLNWPDSTLNRYAIYALERDGGHYDPRRTWTMPDTVITLPDGDLYYLIAKLPLDETVTVGEWVASDTYIRPKSTAGHVWYTAGVINMAESPRVLAMLWGNVRISAGQISAAIDPRLLSGGQMIYLHGNDSDLTGYKKALITQPEDAMATLTAAADSATGDVLIEEFATDADYPGVTVIPAGPWIFNHWVAVGSGTQSILVVKVYKRVAAGTETELLTFTQAVTASVGVEQFKAMPMAQVELLATDRLVVKYYHRNAAAAPATIYLFVEGNAVAEWKWSGYRIPLAPVSGGLATVETDMSVTGDGSVGDPVKLVGDEETPGNSKYYGTDGAGTKGYHDLPEDNYVDGASYDESTHDLTLTRTGTLEDIVVNIPCCDPTEIIQGTVTNVKYGYLYNWWAATDARNIAPSGWHVPTNTEYENLRDYIGTDQGDFPVHAGGYLKETGFIYWNSPNTGSKNSYSFNARGCGSRTSTGFVSIKNHVLFHSSSVDDYLGSDRSGILLQYNNNYFGFSYNNTGYEGKSIRLVKDDSIDTRTMTGNDGKVYPTVTIGTQVWMAANLMETKYRDGSPISGPTFTNAEWAALTTEAYCIYGDDPTNAGDEDEVILQHNLLGGLQGGSATERYHMTNAQHSWMETGAAISATGSFTTADGKTVTYANGIITSVV